VSQNGGYRNVQVVSQNGGYRNVQVVSQNGGYRNVQVLVGKPKERDSSECIGIDWRIIIKLVLKK
jgi:hypothetical protein